MGGGMKGKRLVLLSALLASWALGAGAGCLRVPEREVSEGELFILGEEDLRAKRYEKAREAFQKLLQEYPDSKLRRKALLRLADSFYQEEGFEEAKFQYRKFVELYPVTPDTPHAYYHLGMSDYQRLLAYDRGQANTRDALESFQKLTTRFPNSKFAKDARHRIRYLRYLLAQHDLFVARFYHRRGAYVSAIPRYRELIANYKDMPRLRAEALFYLGKALEEEDSPRKAAYAYQQLLREHPQSGFADRARKRVTRLNGRR